MRESLVNKLRCPVDLGTLRLTVSSIAEDDHVEAGHLSCTTCRNVFPIIEGVPNLIPGEAVKVNGHDLSRLQIDTINRFGFEWRHFENWGWLTDYPDVPNAEERFYGGLLEHSQGAFWSKSLFKVEDLEPGNLVLDAGCGNGRFTYQAAQSGPEVIGIELGAGVHSAFEHMRSLPNVHIVRGDLFRLPFANETFDRIFSIGVLMHTGNASAAFDSVARTLKPNGLIVAHVYGKGLHLYEGLDALIRAATVRLPIKLQIVFARATAAAARWLRGGRWRWIFYRGLFCLINLLPTEHHMFDWWSAPIATHHTPEEVSGWFARNGLQIIRTRPALDDPHIERRRRRSHASVTVLGQRTIESG